MFTLSMVFLFNFLYLHPYEYIIIYYYYHYLLLLMMQVRFNWRFLGIKVCDTEHITVTENFTDNGPVVLVMSSWIALKWSYRDKDNI